MSMIDRLIISLYTSIIQKSNTNPRGPPHIPSNVTREFRSYPFLNHSITSTSKLLQIPKMKNLKSSKTLTQLCAINALLAPSFAFTVNLTGNRTNIKQDDPENLTPWKIWSGEGPMPSWDGSGDLNDWESNLEFVEIPALASARTQQNQRDVCKSLDFALSVENFYLSGAMDWLERYTITAMGTVGFRERGLVGSIAYDYLGDNGLKCGLESTSLCK